MGAVDPTYPLYPAACLLASILLLLVLLTSFVRQSWNLGVAFLCFWLFFENLTNAVSAIIWSDNYDVKNYAYCDIVSHLELFCFVLVPMSTLIILRRLYLIASLQSVDLPSTNTRRWDLVVEWTLGLIIPALIAGPIYYVLQASRFQVIEGSGCTNAVGRSILTEILIASGPIVPPVLSFIRETPPYSRPLKAAQGRSLSLPEPS
ncbi:STE3-domain-containing protein [Peniophora sp. CONT]|nr:STE3-domain-containing protein [Peniophora sp. CONT]